MLRGVSLFTSLRFISLRLIICLFFSWLTSTVARSLLQSQQALAADGRFLSLKTRGGMQELGSNCVFVLDSHRQFLLFSVKTCKKGILFLISRCNLEGFLCNVGANTMMLHEFLAVASLPPK